MAKPQQTRNTGLETDMEEGSTRVNTYTLRSKMTHMITVRASHAITQERKDEEIKPTETRKET